jgi:hypothetical protein
MKDYVRIIGVMTVMTGLAACGGTALPTALRPVRHAAGDPAQTRADGPKVTSAGPVLHAERHVSSARTSPVTSTAVPGAPECPMFPADNIWNTDISKLPVDGHSAAWMRSMDSAHINLHPDFGPSGGYPYGIPYTIVNRSHRLVRIHFHYASDSDPGPYPFGPDTQIEGGKNAGGDRHAIMVNKKTCVLYELFNANYSKHPTAGSGAIWSLRSNKLRPAGATSADAAGLPILPGLLNYQQVAYSARTGKPITHAIRFTAQVTRTHYIWPARHQAGSSNNPNLPPMGARFRLKASFDIAGFCRNSAPFCKDAKAVLIEMKHYGLILADNGSNWFFQGAAFPQWPDTLVSLLKGIPARAFEAVDTSCLMVSPNSGQVRAKPGCRIG